MASQNEIKSTGSSRTVNNQDYNWKVYKKEVPSLVSSPKYSWILEKSPARNQVKNISPAKWIGADLNGVSLPGDYSYQTIFEYSEVPKHTTCIGSLSFGYSADDFVNGIKFNGNEVYTCTNTTNCKSEYSAFLTKTIEGPIYDSKNTLEFIVHNKNNTNGKPNQSGFLFQFVKLTIEPSTCSINKPNSKLDDKTYVYIGTLFAIAFVYLFVKRSKFLASLISPKKIVPSPPGNPKTSTTTNPVESPEKEAIRIANEISRKRQKDLEESNNRINISTYNDTTTNKTSNKQIKKRSIDETETSNNYTSKTNNHKANIISENGNDDSFIVRAKAVIAEADSRKKKLELEEENKRKVLQDAERRKNDEDESIAFEARRRAEESKSRIAAKVAEAKKKNAEEAVIAEAKRQTDKRAAAEAKRQADEKATAAEAKRQADEKAAAEAKRQADEKAAAEAKRQADEKAAAEAKRIADEKAAAEAKRQTDEKAAAEAKRQADEKAAADAKRQADEKAAAEAKRQADEKAAVEAKRQADEKATAAEAKRQADEKATAAEAKRQADEKAAAAEAKRQADEKAAAETKRQADEKAAAEAKRQADEKAAAETKRQADEKAAAEAKRQADEKAAAEAKRIADEKAAAEAKRQTDEKAAAAEAKRQADEKAAAETKRQADEKAAAETKRQTDEKAAAEAKRQADEKAAAEAKRQADEKAAAEAKRIADEKAAAETKRIADEKAAAETKRQADEKAAAEAKRIADEKAAAEAKRQADEKATAAEAKRQADEKAAAAETQPGDGALSVKVEVVQKVLENETDVVNKALQKSSELKKQNEEFVLAQVADYQSKKNNANSRTNSPRDTAVINDKLQKLQTKVQDVNSTIISQDLDQQSSKLIESESAALISSPTPPPFLDAFVRRLRVSGFRVERIKRGIAKDQTLCLNGSSELKWSKSYFSKRQPIVTLKKVFENENKNGIFCLEFENAKIVQLKLKDSEFPFETASMITYFTAIIQNMEKDCFYVEKVVSNLSGNDDVEAIEGGDDENGDVSDAISVASDMTTKSVSNRLIGFLRRPSFNQTSHFEGDNGNTGGTSVISGLIRRASFKNNTAISSTSTSYDENNSEDNTRDNSIVSSLASPVINFIRRNSFKSPTAASQLNTTTSSIPNENSSGNSIEDATVNVMKAANETTNDMSNSNTQAIINRDSESSLNSNDNVSSSGNTSKPSLFSKLKSSFRGGSSPTKRPST